MFKGVNVLGGKCSGGKCPGGRTKTRTICSTTIFLFTKTKDYFVLRKSI